MSFVDQQSRALRSIRSQRTQSEHDHCLRPSPELWIQNVLKDEQECKNVLKNYGIDRASLKTSGIQYADRVYNSLFIYSQGVFSSLEELTSSSFDKKSMMCKLWKVFQLLTNKCKPKIIDEDQVENQKQLSYNQINEQFQSLIALKEQDLSGLQEQIKIRDETIKILEQKLKFQSQELVQYNDLIEERDKLFSQETKKRVNFETKINKIQQVFNENLNLNENLNQKVLYLEKQIQNLESELQEKREIILNLNVNLNESEQRIDNLRCRAFDSETQTRIIKELNQSLEQKQQEYETRKQKDYALIQQLNYQLSISQSQQTKLDILNKQLFKNVESSQNKLDEYQQDVTQKSETIYNYLQQIRDLDMESKLYKQQTQFNQDKLLELSLQTETLATQLKEVVDENSFLKKNQFTLQTQYEQMSANLQLQINDSQECLTTYKELKKEYDIQQEIKAKIEQDLKRFQDLCKQLEQEKRHLIEQVKDTQKKSMFQIQQQDDRSKVLSLQMKKKQETIEDLSNNLKLLTYNNTQLEQQVSSLNSNITEVQNKYSNEIIKKQDAEQQLKLTRQELKNLKVEFKQNEDNLLAYQIKYNTIKEYPNMYKEINEQYQIASKLIDQLNEDIAILSKIKSSVHDYTQTDLNTNEKGIQYELLLVEQDSQTAVEIKCQSTQTKKMIQKIAENQTDIQVNMDCDCKIISDDRQSTQRQNQYTQVELFTQADFCGESQKQSIEIEPLSQYQKSQQQSINFDYESGQTRLLPQYDDLNSDKFQRKLHVKKNSDYIEKSENEDLIETNRVVKNSKGRGKNQKGFELPQIQNNNFDKSSIICNSKTPSAKFAKMYIQASEYYRKQ